MLYSLHDLDQDTLKCEFTALIEAERDFTTPRHVALTRMINELSVTGFPLLVGTARALLDEDRPKPQTWISTPLCSALERMCSGAEGAKPELERRFETLEEDHLLDQLRALLIDLESLLMVSDEDEMSRLRTLLWIGATRSLLARVDEERDQYLRLVLIYASDELGNLALIPEHFERKAGDVLAEHLRLCHVGGGTLSLTLPGESDKAQIIQLKKSGISLDLRGVERLKLEGYGVLDWLDDVERGLDEVRSIEVTMLSDDDVAGLKSRGLFDRVEAGWSTPVVIDEVAGVKLPMVLCPAGELWMGSEEGVGYTDERPRHRVRITKPFLIGQTPVTQALWEAVMGSNPSSDKECNRPVEQVTWFDCVRFCNALSELVGVDPVYDIGSGDEPHVNVHLDRTGYRLPTEAEWEYMAKAGTEFIYAGSNDLDEVAWYDDGISNILQPVAEKLPNSWDIYDCSGHVWEWCSDDWKREIYRGRTGMTSDPHEYRPDAYWCALRGGSWLGDADDCRVSFRGCNSPSSYDNDCGLRLVRSPQVIEPKRYRSD